MMDTEPRGRLFQDSEFKFDEFNGLKIQRLIICRKVDTNEPVIVFLKVENKNWHQYFLDAGIGFWENWDELDDIEDDDYFKYIDSTEKFELKGKLISGIYCKPDFSNSRIILELENNEQLILKCVNPMEIDSDCELIKIKKIKPVCNIS